MADRSVVLIVDDDLRLRQAVRTIVAEDFDEVLEAGDARSALDVAAAKKPELIILDLGLADLPGVRVVTGVRKWSSAPILVLTAHHSEREKIELLEAGADDYVTKPFSPGELRARVRALRRRARLAAGDAVEAVQQVGGVVVDLAKRTAKRDGSDIHLTPTEWSLLRVFLKERGRTLTHHQLFRGVWGTSGGDPQQYLRVYVANLRRKLEPDPVRPKLIITEPGVGYRLNADD